MPQPTLPRAGTPIVRTPVAVAARSAMPVVPISKRAGTPASSATDKTVGLLTGGKPAGLLTGGKPAGEPPKDDPNVVDLITDADSAIKQIKSNAAAFSLASNAADNTNIKRMPLMTWTANFRGTPVEVTSDTDQLTDAQRDKLVNILIQLHGNDLLASAHKLLDSAQALVDSLEETIAADKTPPAKPKPSPVVEPEPAEDLYSDEAGIPVDD